jgi:hypothetical protein
MDKSSIIVGSLMLIIVLAYLSVRSFYHLSGGNDVFRNIEKIEIRNQEHDTLYCIQWCDSIFNQEENLRKFEKLMLNSNEYDGVHKKILPINEHLKLMIKTNAKEIEVDMQYAGPDQYVYLDIMWPGVNVDQRRSFGLAKFLDSLCLVK